METKELNLTISIDEANIILNALTKQPFEQVATLINKVQKQAAEQLQPENNGSKE